MLSAISRRRRPTPLNAVARALPDLPHWKNGHGHPRAVAVASATAGLAVGTAACAVLLTRHGEPAGDEGEQQAPAGAEE